MKTYLEVGVGLYCMPLSSLAFQIVSETVKGWHPTGAARALLTVLLHPISTLYLSRHLDFFEMVRNEDDLELARRFDMVRCLWGWNSCMGSPATPK